MASIGTLRRRRAAYAASLVVPDLLPLGWTSVVVSNQSDPFSVDPRQAVEMTSETAEAE